MTTASDALSPANPPPDPGPNPANTAPGVKTTVIEAVAVNDFWPKVETLLQALSEKLNPILVKEARQAMKSKQFSVTFTLLLVVGWIYTMLFVILNLPGVFYSPFGSAMLFGYYLILAVPLLIVVPYASFRSLAAELEDGTFDLLSITALSARQIVTGKLGSSVLQMIVYYSALAPCISFTYLLRGIDVVTIGIVLSYTFLASLMLSILALTLSTVTRARHWQVLLSVLLVIALLLFGFFWCMMMFSILASASMMPYDESWYWMTNLAVVTFYVPLALLFILIAAGQVTFASENRSTGVRITLMVLQGLIVGWTVYGFLLERRHEEGVLMVGSGFIGALWAVAGAFLIGETAQLSPRAQRELPQSVLGRMMFTWFNPGSGTGYMFAILNALGGMLTLAFLGLFTSLMVGSGGLNRLDVWSAWWLTILGYLAAYLGLARLCGIGLRTLNFGGGMLGTFVSYVVMLLFGILLPLMMQALFRWLFDAGYGAPFEYTLLQSPNWFWTLIEVGNDRAAVMDGTVWLITLFGVAIFLINFVLAAKEVEHTRVAAPNRVLQDELELHPLPAPVKRGPWDEPPPSPK